MSPRASSCARVVSTSRTPVDLFHHRWAVPILAELHRHGGSRFVPLAKGLRISHESLRQTLAALIDAGLVLRNPGYGHPLLPEYVLTAAGRRIAPVCLELVETLQRLGFEDGGLKKWSIPVLLELGRERRFVELRDALAISPRAHARVEGARRRRTGRAARARQLPAVDELPRDGARLAARAHGCATRRLGS
jgi:DNA-binding HxlR family transcriptional regulator